MGARTRKEKLIKRGINCCFAFHSQLFIGSKCIHRLPSLSFFLSRLCLHFIYALNKANSLDRSLALVKRTYLTYSFIYLFLFFFMKLSTDKCSKYKIINSLNTLSVTGKITDGNKRGPLIFASNAIFTFSTRFVTRYCNKSYNFRKNRYFHSPRLEIISIQLSRLYQLSSLDSTRTQNKIFSLLKIEFLETGGNDRNSALSSREERAWAI